MQRNIILAAVIMVLAGSAAAAAARADEWCGYTSKDKAVIECGYTTAQQCESAVGQGGMCFVDPDNALNRRQAAPATMSKSPASG